MVGYHCKVEIAAPFYEIFSFNIIELTMLIVRGWLPDIAKCLPGAFI